MPEKRIGTCDICGRHNVERMLIVGGIVDGRIYIGWVCSRCRLDLSQLREEMANHGGSESQERTPAGSAGGQQKKGQEAANHGRNSGQGLGLAGAGRRI